MNEKKGAVLLLPFPVPVRGLELVLQPETDVALTSFGNWEIFEGLEREW